MSPLLACLTAPPPALAFVVAFSGGLDSTVLLHLALAAGLRYLSAVHVHHGLQAAADDWARHCESQCLALGVDFSLARVSVPPASGQGPEAAARAARYAALSAAVPPGGVLLTAHHRDDQAETVLLRLFRGTGLAGLSGMATQGHTAQGTPLWRPLLDVPRAALHDYARAQGLRWIEDPHNADPRYARSWLRAIVMPPLNARWPGADAAIARAAVHAAEAQALLDRYAARLLAEHVLPDGSLRASGLKALPMAERHLLLRHALAARALPKPDTAMLRRLDAEVLGAAADAEPLLVWPGAECRRYRDRLYLAAPLVAVPTEAIEWDGHGPLRLPQGLGQLHSEAPEPMQVRFDLAGVRLKPEGSAHTRTLKQLCQTAGIPPWWRRRLPLVFVDGALVSVAGRWNTPAAPRLHWHAPTDWGLPP